jgi:hypothetical protein
MGSVADQWQRSTMKSPALPLPRMLLTALDGQAEAVHVRPAAKPLQMEWNDSRRR